MIPSFFPFEFRLLLLLPRLLTLSAPISFLTKKTNKHSSPSHFKISDMPTWSRWGEGGSANAPTRSCLLFQVIERVNFVRRVVGAVVDLDGVGKPRGSAVAVVVVAGRFRV